MQVPGTTPTLPDPPRESWEGWVDYDEKAIIVPYNSMVEHEVRLVHDQWYYVKVSRRDVYVAEFTGRFDFDAGREEGGYGRLCGFVIDGDGTIMLHPEDMTLIQTVNDDPQFLVPTLGWAGRKAFG